MDDVSTNAPEQMPVSGKTLPPVLDMTKLLQAATMLQEKEVKLNNDIKLIKSALIVLNEKMEKILECLKNLPTE